MLGVRVGFGATKSASTAASDSAKVTWPRDDGANVCLWSTVLELAEFADGMYGRASLAPACISRLPTLMMVLRVSLLLCGLTASLFVVIGKSPECVRKFLRICFGTGGMSVSSATCVACVVSDLDRPELPMLRNLCNRPGLTGLLPILRAEPECSEVALCGELGDSGTTCQVRELLDGEMVSCLASRASSLLAAFPVC